MRRADVRFYSRTYRGSKTLVASPSVPLPLDPQQETVPPLSPDIGVGEVLRPTCPTTTLCLAHELALRGESVLVIDLDPQGNATQGFGVRTEDVQCSIADLIRERTVPTKNSVIELGSISLIPATPLLARVEGEMFSLTNSQMRLAQRLRSFARNYSVVLLDTPPTFGPLMNTALNAASEVLIPVNSNFFALVGIKAFLGEIEEIQLGSNPNLSVLGYLLTLADHTKMIQVVRLLRTT